MIKTWYKFNENTDNLKDILSQKLSEVREIFYELEDLGIIKYNFITPGYERSGGTTFDPRIGNQDNFIENKTSIIRLTYKSAIRNTPDNQLLILIDIKLPGESNEFGSTVIGNDGIDLFDDIISGVNRLKDLGYNVKLDFNASHHEYKPLKILAYFYI